MTRTTQVFPLSINEPPDPANLVPVIDALEPASCAVGDPDFTLVVRGTGFVQQVTAIHFAGNDEPTTFNETDHSLSTIVKPSLWTEPVVVQCSVHNGELTSNSVDFTFEQAATRSDDRKNVSHETGGRHGHASGHGGSGRHTRR